MFGYFCNSLYNYYNFYKNDLKSELYYNINVHCYCW